MIFSNLLINPFFYEAFCNFFVINIFNIYIKYLKIYQINIIKKIKKGCKENLRKDIKIFLKKKKRKSNDMVKNVTKIS